MAKRAMKAMLWLVTVMVCSGSVFAVTAADFPAKAVTLIVPWAPGGSTDQVTRVTAAELEKHLGQKIVILNQPGASGSVGTKNAMEAPKDGYTWTAGAAKDLGSYKVLGMVDTSLNDWNVYLNVAHVAVVGVNADTPFKTMPELLAAMKARPGAISVATAGVNSSGHSAIEAVTRAAGVTYKPRPPWRPAFSGRVRARTVAGGSECI